MHDDRNPEGTPRRPFPRPRPPHPRSPLRAVFLAAIAAVAVATVPSAFAEGVSLDKLDPVMVARPVIGEFPAVVVIVGLDNRGQAIAVGQGVVLEKREKTCTILSATGAIGKSSQAFVRYADDTVGDLLRVVRWEPAPGLVLLEAKGPCPAVAKRLPGDVDPAEVAGPVTVYGAPTWGLQVAPVRATLDPQDTTGSRRRHEGEAGGVRLEEEVLASFVFAGAPVLDSRDRLVGILGRPRKDGRSFGFLPVPSREDLLAAATRSDRLLYYTRLQRRYHPIRPKLDAALFGMAYYWGNLLDLAIRLMAIGNVPRGNDPRYLAAMGDALLRSPQDKMPRASTLLAKAASRLPQDARLAGLLGYALLFEGDAPGAERAYRRALQLAPDSLIYQLDLGAVLVVQHRWSEAEPVLRKLLRQEPDDASAWINLALVLLHRGLVDEALDMSRTAAEKAPRHADILAMRGIILLQAEKWHEARRVLERAIEIKDSPLFQLNLGMALLLCGEAEKGKQKLEKVFDELDEDALPDLRVIHALVREGKVPAAIRLLHRISLPGIRDADTWREIGKRAEETGEWALSEQAWAEVLDREPSSVTAKAHRGVALVFLHRFAEAEKLLAPCAEQAPDSSRVLGFLALARIGQGKTDEALPLLERLDQLDPAFARSVRAAWDKRRQADASGRRKRRRRSRRGH